MSTNITTIIKVMSSVLWVHKSPCVKIKLDDRTAMGFGALPYLAKSPPLSLSLSLSLSLEIVTISCNNKVIACFLRDKDKDLSKLDSPSRTRHRLAASAS